MFVENFREIKNMLPNLSEKLSYLKNKFKFKVKALKNKLKVPSFLLKPSTTIDSSSDLEDNLFHLVFTHIQGEKKIVLQDLLFLKSFEISKISQLLISVTKSELWERGNRKETTLPNFFLMLTFFECLRRELKGKDISKQVMKFEEYAEKYGIDLFVNTDLAKNVFMDIRNFDLSSSAWGKGSRPKLEKLHKTYPPAFEISYWQDPNFFTAQEFKKMISAVAKVILEIEGEEKAKNESQV